MLSEKEAHEFINDILEIESNEVPKNGASGDHRLHFLNKITFEFQQRIPFQNLIALSNESRSLPSRANIKKQMSSKWGGLCYGLNSFMCDLLKVLGYDAYIGLAAVNHSKVADHYLVLIRDVVKRPDLYLVDVGFGFPSLEAFCMNFDKESQEYQHSFCKFKFARQGNQFYRLKFDANARRDTKFETQSPFDTVYEDGWVIFYKFQTNELPLTEENISGVKRMYVEPDSHFLNCFRLSGFVDGKALIFKDDVMLAENQSSHKLEATKMSAEDLPKLIHKYYPQFDKELIVKALASLDSFTKAK